MIVNIAWFDIYDSKNDSFDNYIKKYYNINVERGEKIAMNHNDEFAHLFVENTKETIDDLEWKEIQVLCNTHELRK